MTELNARLTPEREQEIRAYVEANARVIGETALLAQHMVHRNERQITLMATQLLAELDAVRGELSAAKAAVEIYAADDALMSDRITTLSRELQELKESIAVSEHIRERMSAE